MQGNHKKRNMVFKVWRHLANSGIIKCPGPKVSRARRQQEVELYGYIPVPPRTVKGQAGLEIIRETTVINIL